MNGVIWYLIQARPSLETANHWIDLQGSRALARSFRLLKCSNAIDEILTGHAIRHHLGP